MKKKTQKIYPKRSSEVLVNQKMLYGVRDELKHDIRALDEKFGSQFHGLKSEVHGLKSEVHGLKSEVHGLKSIVETLSGNIHRIGLLVEDQNNKNRIVLEGLNNLFTRQDRVENDLQEIKQFIFK